jgi:Tfp pilus assembly protein PilV
LKTILILYNKKGMTLMECIIALVLTTIAVVSLMSMQTLAWRGAGKSDYLGRAQGILQRELETFENNFRQGAIPSCYGIFSCISCSCNGITPCTCNGTTPPWTSTYKITEDNIPFTINVSATVPATPANTWLVNVQITWPGNVNGIKSSIIVSNDY